MKYETAQSFKADYRKLNQAERALFKDAIKKINASHAKQRAQGAAGRPQWPKDLRIKPVTDAPGIFEMTWSFAGPDGRATFEYFDAGGDDVGIRWRRIGDHRILKVRNA